MHHLASLLKNRRPCRLPIPGATAEAVLRLLSPQLRGQIMLPRKRQKDKEMRQIWHYKELHKIGLRKHFPNFGLILSIASLFERFNTLKEVQIWLQCRQVWSHKRQPAAQSNSPPKSGRKRKATNVE